MAATLLPVRSGSAGPSQTPSAQAAALGEWSESVNWPGIGIHTALLATGKVLTYSYPQGGLGSAAWVWDPATDTLDAVPLDRNIFCSGQSFLADGRLLVTGGHLGGQAEGHEGGGVAADASSAGTADTHIFDPFTEEWTRVGDMATARWYPTNVMLANGQTLVFAGNDETGSPTDIVEIYDPASGMQVVPGASPFLPIYPRMHLLPSGKVFDAGPQALTGTFDPATVTWEEIGSSSYGSRSGGASVLLPLQPPDYRPKVLIVGGGGGDFEPATDTVEIIDLADPSPSWIPTGSMSYGRRNLNTVLLPDGTVLVVGGATTGQATNPVLQAEIFDPESGSWSEVASMQRPRVYHSTAILLPDGRVAAAGSGGEFTVEIYSPPYLFQGARPQISSVPQSVTYGIDFEVSTLDAQDIAKVVLMRPGAVTHSVDMDQRNVELSFQAGTDSLTVEAPANGNLAPPGYYMLFAVNADGVPSEASFVRLSIGAVGGIAELPDVDQPSLAVPDASGPSAGLLAGVVTAVAGALVLGGSAAWWVLRRKTS